MSVVMAVADKQKPWLTWFKPEDMPGCCSYPGFSGYNHHEHRDLKCSKDLRCLVTQFDAPCDLGDDEEDLEPEAEKMQPAMLAGRLGIF